MSAHLGAWLSPLADGQLSPPQTERALAHVAACCRCRAGLAAERAARGALADAAEVRAAPDLADRLLMLCASVPPTAGDPLRERRTTPVGDPVAPALVRMTGEVVPRAGRRARWFGVFGIGGGVLAAAVLLGAGGLPAVVPDATTAGALSVLDHAQGAGSGGGPGARDLTWLAEHGWAGPADLPAGLEVTSVRYDDAGLRVVELDLAGPSGRVVVREQRGHLAAGTATAEQQVIGGRAVTVLSTQPWHVAWQAGDVVIDLTADVDRAVLEEVTAQFPADAYETGLLPRLVRGWGTVRSLVAAPP